MHLHISQHLRITTLSQLSDCVRIILSPFSRLDILDSFISSYYKQIY